MSGPAASGADDSLLGRFGGEKPAASRWFSDAIAIEPRRSAFTVDGAAIELLTWGEVGQPGLLFLHGNAAHADWWSFIAPQFAATHRCAAISWSGMGGSDWRERYSLSVFAKEALTAIDEGGLAASGAPPAIVAHSFGGFITRYIGERNADAALGAILVDSIPPRSEADRPPRLGEGRGDHVVHPSLAAALQRFRFLPEQGAEHLEIVDHIARKALLEVPAADGRAGGWSWRFDPQVWDKFDRADLDPFPVPRFPVGAIYGEESAMFAGDRIRELVANLPDCRFVTAIAGAHHHVMVDRPLELVAAIREGLPLLAD